MIYAPIYIPTLNRSEHFQKCIESLKANTWARYTDVYIALDYPPSEKYRAGYEKICGYLESGEFDCFKSFNVVKREKNYGAGINSKRMREFISGKYDRWIYAEDDIVFSPIFLEYMDKALEKYEIDETVLGVNGYSYPLTYKVNNVDANIIKQKFTFSMWGAGFWKDKYNKAVEILSSDYMYNCYPEMKKNGKIKQLIKGRYYDYMFHALTDSGRYFKVVSDMSLGVYMSFNDLYVITPLKSKTRNAGFDGTGLCCQNIAKIDNKTSLTYDYNSQEIDEGNDNEEVCLIEDDETNLDENKNLFDAFLVTDIPMKRKVKILLFLEKILGRNLTAKIYQMLKRIKNGKK